MKDLLSVSQINAAAKMVADYYHMSIEMAYEYIDEWMIHAGRFPHTLRKALESHNIAYLFQNLDMSVPEAVEHMDYLRENFTITVTKELPGTVWTCIYGNLSSLPEARKAYIFFSEHSQGESFESQEYNDYLSLIEEGYSEKDAFVSVFNYYDLLF